MGISLKVADGQAYCGNSMNSCEFGACGAGPMGFAPGEELHHIFSQQFVDWFEEHGVDISKYLIPLAKAAHRLTPNGIHTKAGGDWNSVWEKWIEEHPNAAPQAIMEQGKKMLVQFGISAGDVLPDVIITVNPCVTIRDPLYQQAMCGGGGGV